MKLSTLIVSVLFSTLPLIMGGCTAHPEPAPAVVIDKTLPQVKINGYLSDMVAIAFEWKPVTDPRVKGIRIYRDTPDGNDTKTYRIATIDSTLQTHYVDNGLKPATTYRYRFTTFDAQGHESQPEETITAHTLGLPEAVSFFTATKELARSAKLLWRPHPDPRITSYEIQRLDPGDKTFHQIATIDGRLHAEYIDTGLEDNQIYRYRIIAVAYDGIKSPPTAAITVATKPLPKAPGSLQASREGAGVVTLQWRAPPNKDIAYYNVYRSDSSNGAFEYLAKVPATTFTDKNVANGAHYFYKVTAVDKDGLESLSSALAEGSTMTAPKAPTLTKAVLQNNAVKLSWTDDDRRAVSYTIVKTARSGWFDSKETLFKGIKTTAFTDVNVSAGHDYDYEIIAVDAHGLSSAPSESKSVTFEAE